MPTIILRAFASRLRVTAHRRVEAVHSANEIAIRSLDERPLPLQVDGDYIGEVATAHFEVVPGGLLVVA